MIAQALEFFTRGASDPLHAFRHMIDGTVTSQRTIGFHTCCEMHDVPVVEYLAHETRAAATSKGEFLQDGSHVRAGEMWTATGDQLLW